MGTAVPDRWRGMEQLDTLYSCVCMSLVGGCLMWRVLVNHLGSKLCQRHLGVFGLAQLSSQCPCTWTRLFISLLWDKKCLSDAESGECGGRRSYIFFCFSTHFFYTLAHFRIFCRVFAHLSSFLHLFPQLYTFLQKIAHLFGDIFQDQSYVRAIFQTFCNSVNCYHKETVSNDDSPFLHPWWTGPSKKEAVEAGLLNYYIT